MSEISEGGRLELKASLVSKIIQLLKTDGEVSQASYAMRWAISDTCLPDIVRSHVISSIKSNQVAVAAMVEAQVAQLKAAAAANGILIDDTTVVEATRGEDEQPEVDLPPQDIPPMPNEPFDEAEEMPPSDVAGATAVRHGKPKKVVKKAKAKRKPKRKAS